MPITTTKGGINALSNVMRKPSICIVARLYITPTITTNKESSVVLRDLKKMNSISADSKIEPKRNHCISLAILTATLFLINGSPLKWSS